MMACEFAIGMTLANENVVWPRAKRTSGNHARVASLRLYFGLTGVHRPPKFET
jgi:hypothetical protein